MYNSIRMHFRERPLRPWVATNLNYEFVDIKLDIKSTGFESLLPSQYDLLNFS
jgi:hypothetical protein